MDPNAAAVVVAAPKRRLQGRCAYKPDTEEKRAHKILFNHEIGLWAEDLMALHMIPRNEFKACVVDTRFGYSSQALINIGVRRENIYAINACAEGFDDLPRHLGVRCFAMHSSEFFALPDLPKFHLLLYDVCATFNTEKDNILAAFKLLAPEAAVCYTLSYRTGNATSFEPAALPHTPTSQWERLRDPAKLKKRKTVSPTVKLVDGIIKDWAYVHGRQTEQVWFDKIPTTDGERGPVFFLAYEFATGTRPRTRFVAGKCRPSKFWKFE